MKVDTYTQERPVATAEAKEVIFQPKAAYNNLKKAALVLRALNHKLRQQILSLIEAENKITVTEIYVKMRLEQSVASQHLAILRKAAIVDTQRDGKFIYYTINYDRLAQINSLTDELVK